MSKLMFKEVARTWNPWVGCPHGCSYCYARRIVERRGESFEGHLAQKELDNVPRGGLVFCCSLGDLWAESVPDQVIRDVLLRIRTLGKEATFLMLTKNPARYLGEFVWPVNIIVGVTIESDIWYRDISHAPPQHTRYKSMMMLKQKFPGLRRMVCIEPIMQFTERDEQFFGPPGSLLDMVRGIAPEFIYVGYDNHHHHLPEPPMGKTEWLIGELEKFTQVRRKTIRMAWDE